MVFLVKAIRNVTGKTYTSSLMSVIISLAKSKEHLITNISILPDIQQLVAATENPEKNKRSSKNTHKILTCCFDNVR